MKKFLLFFQAVACAVFIFACANNPTSSKDVPPAPKPDNFPDTIAVAAKKADFYARLAFDLADGYLSDTSVVRKRYGKDGKYLESLEFGSADHDGIIYTSDISAPSLKYWHTNEYNVFEIMITSGVGSANLPTKTLKRKSYMTQITGTNHPSSQCDITFRKTDITGGTTEQIPLSLTFTQPGFLTAKGAAINITTPFTIYVQNSSDHFIPFNVVINDLKGAVKGVLTDIAHTSSPADEFVINSGKIIVTGTDADSNPNVSYKIELTYSNDTVENQIGNFTSSDSNFTANYTITKDEAYYSDDGSSTRKHYVYWDYPL